MLSNALERSQFWLRFGNTQNLSNCIGKCFRLPNVCCFHHWPIQKSIFHSMHYDKENNDKCVVWELRYFADVYEFSKQSFVLSVTLLIYPKLDTKPRISCFYNPITICSWKIFLMKFHKKFCNNNIDSCRSIFTLIVAENMQ